MPSVTPSSEPTVSNEPSVVPSRHTSAVPSVTPSDEPSEVPLDHPSFQFELMITTDYSLYMFSWKLVDSNENVLANVFSYSQAKNISFNYSELASFPNNDCVMLRLCDDHGDDVTLYVVHRDGNEIINTI